MPACAQDASYVVAGTAQGTKRWGWRVADETGTIDITLWGQVAEQCARFRVGEWVFLDGVVTVGVESSRMQQEEDASDVNSSVAVVLNAVAELGARALPISSLGGLLNAAWLLPTVTLRCDSNAARLVVRERERCVQMCS